MVGGQERGQRQDERLRRRQGRQRRGQRHGNQPLDVRDAPRRRPGDVLQAGQTLGLEPVAQGGTREPPAPLGQVHGHDLDGEGEALQQGHDLPGRGPLVIAGEPALGLVAGDQSQGVVLGQLVDGQKAVASVVGAELLGTQPRRGKHVQPGAAGEEVGVGRLEQPGVVDVVQDQERAGLGRVRLAGPGRGPALGPLVQVLQDALRRAGVVELLRRR